MSPKRTFVDCIAVFLPHVHLPIESIPAISAGITLLGICVYTTVLPSHKSYRLVRMALSIPAFYYFTDFAFSTWYERKHNRSTYLTLATVACYGMMKTLEYCWIREMDDDRPRWIKKDAIPRDPREGGKDGGTGAGEVAKNATGSVMPLPETALGRLSYTFDLLTSIRGVSWWGDRTWDFAQAWLPTWIPPSGASRSAYIKACGISLLRQYILFDIFDAFDKEISWDKATPTPVTSLPPLLQVATTISVCVTTMLYLTVPFTVMSMIIVALGGSPTCWAPMFDAPLTSNSLRDFWFRWHHIFRRVFSRLSLPFLYFLPTTDPTYRRLSRQLVTFFLTTMLHLLILFTLPPRPVTPENPYPHHHSFFDPSTIKFFLAQPLGLLIETTVVFPTTEQLSPTMRSIIRRTFGWIWLLLTARYWADAWIGQGLYDETERPIVWSPVRGIWKGEWII